MMLRTLFVWLSLSLLATAADSRLLYVAVPGIRDYLEFGGHGLLVFDINADHQFVKRLPLRGLNAAGKPMNVKGICASAETGRVYVSTIATIECLDLATGKSLWERTYEQGCDRLAISPDGRTIYVPSFEKTHWKALDAATGDELARLRCPVAAHNTVYGPDGRWVYMADRLSNMLGVADTGTHTRVREIGPFGHFIRPFTINGRQTRCYCCVDGLLGFEIGDLTTGKMIHRIEVPGVTQGPVKMHGCPSHGVGLTPDEKEIWVTDAHNHKMHVYDARPEPPVFKESVTVCDEPGWITFSVDGRFAYPSTGEVIDVASKKILTLLKDEEGRAVRSEKLLEIDFADGKPVKAGNQFGVGGVR